LSRSPFDGESAGDISASDISAIFSPSFFSPEQKMASSSSSGPRRRNSSSGGQDFVTGIAVSSRHSRSTPVTTSLNNSLTTMEDSSHYDRENESGHDRDNSGLNESLLVKFNSCDVAGLESATKRKRYR
jgi:hypothetical protein